MKIKKLVSFEQDVEIEICKEDISGALAELDASSRGRWLLGCINSIAEFLKAIPDETIAEMNQHQKDCIRGFLHDQANRFTYVADTLPGTVSGRGPVCSSPE